MLDRFELGLTPRLSELTRLLRETSDDEFRMLHLVLSEQILLRERQFAERLRKQIGRRCDVNWPGQAELWDVLLVDVDEEAGTACIQYSNAGKRLDVPASCVAPRG